jgi:hypothetical protein
MVEIVIGGVPTVLEVGYMCLFISLGRILVQDSVSTNLFGPMRHQLDLRKVEVWNWAPHQYLSCVVLATVPYLEPRVL